MTKRTGGISAAAFMATYSNAGASKPADVSPLERQTWLQAQLVSLLERLKAAQTHAEVLALADEASRLAGLYASDVLPCPGCGSPVPGCGCEDAEHDAEDERAAVERGVLGNDPR